jgi:hypothetical protein
VLCVSNPRLMAQYPAAVRGELASCPSYSVFGCSGDRECTLGGMRIATKAIVGVDDAKNTFTGTKAARAVA